VASTLPLDHPNGTFVAEEPKNTTLSGGIPQTRSTRWRQAFEALANPPTQLSIASPSAAMFEAFCSDWSALLTARELAGGKLRPGVGRAVRRAAKPMKYWVCEGSVVNVIRARAASPDGPENEMREGHNSSGRIIV
jgi:hypothetical protein